MQFQSQSSHVPHVAAAATPPLVAEAAAAHGFSREAATALWQALQRGQGRMAQFEHAELGGAGQWMAGGMTMLASMGDAALRARVDALAATLAPYAERAAASVAATPPAASGRARADAWGAAAASGAQNDLKYAYYPEARRLVIEDAQGLQVYDTGMHQIQGVSQQSGQGVPRFQTAHGAVELAQLRRVADTPDTSGDGAPLAAGPGRSGRRQREQHDGIPSGSADPRRIGSRARRIRAGRRREKTPGRRLPRGGSGFGGIPPPT